MKYQKRQIYRGRNETSGCLDLGRGAEMNSKWTYGSYLGDENVLKPDYADDYTIQ
jgi:hypothetical protein